MVDQKVTVNRNDQKVQLVYCLSMDLIESTRTGLEFSTATLDHFNMSLVQQIMPHLQHLGLSDALLKFTGDGWLLMTHKAEKVPALCCMATIMAKRFQQEMSQITGIDVKRVPALRLSICSGRDVSIELPEGHIDWVGDSARRATRSSKCCLPNEILIDEPVRYHVLRDFRIKPADIRGRLLAQQPVQMEEDFTLYILGELNPEKAAESIAPEYFVYTLGIIGKIEEAGMVAQRIAKSLASKATKLDVTKKKDLRENWRSWHRLMVSVPDYSSALETLKGIRAGGLAPDVITYSVLIDKSPDYDTAKGWLEIMRTEGIKPNAPIYNTLMNKSPDYDTAKNWLETMRTESIKPNAPIYNTLINKSPNYDTAKDWLETMRTEAIKPNVVTYSTLVNKAPTYKEAKGWLYRMLKEGIRPNVVTFTTLIDKTPNYDKAKALLDKMYRIGVQPNVALYSALLTKDLSHKSAADVLEWYLAQKYHPEEAIQAAIANYRKAGCIDQAFRLILDYPHLAMARKVIREHPEEALAYFRTMCDNEPEHPNTNYALGAALMALEKEREAKPYLRKALKLARPGIRQKTIRKWLRQISRKISETTMVEDS
jgi:tetratricopeptide (TPR) repeat protein